MGATNSTRKLTIDSIALLEMLEPNTAEAQAKARAQLRIQAILTKEWPTARVLAFGSSESGLGFGGSDLDLGLYFDDVDSQSHCPPPEQVRILSIVCDRLARDFEIKEFVQHARVPVVKLWDPIGQIACDLCIGSVHVLLNTALLKHYGRSDPRVRPLAFAVKHWAKQRGINDSVNGTLSSYGFMLLLIFYLQSARARALLPPVGSLFHAVQTERSLTAVVNRIDSLSVAALSSTFGSTDRESVGALLCGFFRFYAHDFNHDDEVVSVRLGQSLAKSSKWSRAVPWRLSIEDPFELSHDVGRVVFSCHGQALLRSEFQRAYEMAISGHRLREICARDETAWDTLATCYVCAAATHTPRECSQAVLRSDGSTVAVGKRPVMSAGAVGDCWYCGGAGHVKATCPLYAYVAIPCPPPLVARATPMVATPTVSTPVAIRQSMPHQRNAVWPAEGPLDLSPVRTNKKKKRPRRGSISSVASSPERQHTRKYMLATAGQLARQCGNPPRRNMRAPPPNVSIPCAT